MFTELPAGHWPGMALRAAELGRTFHKDSHEGLVSEKVALLSLFPGLRAVLGQLLGRGTEAQRVKAGQESHTEIQVSLSLPWFTHLVKMEARFKPRAENSGLPIMDHFPEAMAESGPHPRSAPANFLLPCLRRRLTSFHPSGEDLSCSAPSHRVLCRFPMLSCHQPHHLCVCARWAVLCKDGGEPRLG